MNMPSCWVVCTFHLVFFFLSFFLSLLLWSNTQSDSICCDCSGVSRRFRSRKTVLEGQQFLEFHEPNLRKCSDILREVSLEVESWSSERVKITFLTSEYLTCSSFRSKFYVGKEAVFFSSTFLFHIFNFPLKAVTLSLSQTIRTMHCVFQLINFGKYKRGSKANKAYSNVQYVLLTGYVTV